MRRLPQKIAFCTGNLDRRVEKPLFCSIFVPAFAVSVIGEIRVFGQTLSIDPVPSDVNTAGHFNRYVYANNSPYKYIDPDGRDATWISHKDKTDILQIKVLGTGAGATPEAMTALKAQVERIGLPVGTKISMQVVTSGGPGVNTLNMSPGLHTSMCGAAGECVNKLGGNMGHIDSSKTGASNAGAHEVMHFAGIDDAYIEGPPTPGGERTSVPKPGYDDTNIMTSRAGTSLKASQLNEAKNNPTTRKENEK